MGHIYFSWIWGGFFFFLDLLFKASKWLSVFTEYTVKPFYSRDIFFHSWEISCNIYFWDWFCCIGSDCFLIDSYYTSATDSLLTILVRLFLFHYSIWFFLPLNSGFLSQVCTHQFLNQIDVWMHFREFYKSRFHSFTQGSLIQNLLYFILGMCILSIPLLHIYLGLGTTVLFH